MSDTQREPCPVCRRQPRLFVPNNAFDMPGRDLYGYQWHCDHGDSESGALSGPCNDEFGEEWDATIREMREKACAAFSKRFTVPVVCMCGSTRFKRAWISENARLTGEGNIVLSVGLWGHHERKEPDTETKTRLDVLHLRKIDLCDWVWVLDIGGYIGESTCKEIEYAVGIGKPIRYLSVELPGYEEPIDEVAQDLDAARAECEAVKAELAIAEADKIALAEKAIQFAYSVNGGPYCASIVVSDFLAAQQKGGAS